MSGGSRNNLLPRSGRGRWFGSERVRPRWRPAGAAVAYRLTILLVVAVALAGCGKKGNPQAPPGEVSTYPKVYPSE